jgi:hypothetical protein
LCLCLPAAKERARAPPLPYLVDRLAAVAPSISLDRAAVEALAACKDMQAVVASATAGLALVDARARLHAEAADCERLASAFRTRETAALTCAARLRRLVGDAAAPPDEIEDMLKQRSDSRAQRDVAGAELLARYGAKAEAAAQLVALAEATGAGGDGTLPRRAAAAAAGGTPAPTLADALAAAASTDVGAKAVCASAARVNECVDALAGAVAAMHAAVGSHGRAIADALDVVASAAAEASARDAQTASAASDLAHRSVLELSAGIAACEREAALVDAGARLAVEAHALAARREEVWEEVMRAKHAESIRQTRPRLRCGRALEHAAMMPRAAH